MGASGSKSPPPPFAVYTNTARTVYPKAPLLEGAPGPEHFEIRDAPLRVTLGSDAKEEGKETKEASDEDELPEGAILLKVLAMSADPYLRGSIKPDSAPAEGKVMTGFVAGKVLASRHSNWVAGDLLGAALPFTTVQVVPAAVLDNADVPKWKLTGHLTEDEISKGVGVLGMPGSTAYGGLIDVLRPKAKTDPEAVETIFVSSASGAVGSMVGQIAKNVYGCNVVGSAGGPEKVRKVCETYGFDHAIDYKALQASDGDAGLKDLQDQLKEAAPKGIDMYFENVGGIHFDAALAALRPHGRIAVCGCISSYNDAERAKNAISIGNLIYTFQRIEGFVCMPWLTGRRGNFLEDMSRWLREGKIIAEETFFDGVDEWPTAFNSLFENTGRKSGKVVVRIAHPDETIA